MLGAAQLAAVRHEQQPGPLGDPERAARSRRSSRAARRWRGRSRPRRGRRTAPASRARVRASSGCRVRLAAMTTAIPSPVCSRRVAHRVEDQVGERGDPAEPGGVPARVDLDLQPPAAVAHVVLGGLAHQPAYVVLGAQHATGPRRRAAGTGTSPSRRPPTAAAATPRPARRAARMPVALGELEQRGVPHRAGEVQVQVRLGRASSASCPRPRRALRRRSLSFSAAASSTQVATASIASGPRPARGRSGPAGCCGRGVVAVGEGRSRPGSARRRPPWPARPPAPRCRRARRG